jgi:hypothetical protein
MNMSRGSQHGISKAKKGEEAIDVGGGGSSWPDEVCQSPTRVKRALEQEE